MIRKMSICFIGGFQIYCVRKYVSIHKNAPWSIDCINTVSGGELESISYASDAD